MKLILLPVLVVFLLATEHQLENIDLGAEILDAASNGNLKKLQDLDEDGNLKKPFLDRADLSGCTAVHHAAQKGFFKIVKLLAEKEADLDKADTFGSTPVRTAAKYGHLKIVELLAEKNVDLDKADDEIGHTPIHSALMQGNFEIVELLAEKKVDLNKVDNEGFTPAHFAAQYGNFEIVKLLAEKKVNLEKANKYGFTPLHTAAMDNHPDIVALLVEKEVNLDKANGKGLTPVHIAVWLGHLEIIKLLAGKADLDQTDNEGSAPVHTATKHGNLKIVKLLANKADLNQTDGSGFTPVYHAVRLGKLKIVEFLVEQNVNLEEQLLSITKDIQTRDIKAYSYKARDDIKKVIAKALAQRQGAEKELEVGPEHLKHIDVGTAIKEVADGNREELKRVAECKNLKKADFDEVDSLGKTPVNIAAHRGRLEMAQAVPKSSNVLFKIVGAVLVFGLWFFLVFWTPIVPSQPLKRAAAFTKPLQRAAVFTKPLQIAAVFTKPLQTAAPMFAKLVLASIFAASVVFITFAANKGPTKFKEKSEIMLSVDSKIGKTQVNAKFQHDVKVELHIDEEIVKQIVDDFAPCSEVLMLELTSVELVSLENVSIRMELEENVPVGAVVHVVHLFGATVELLGATMPEEKVIEFTAPVSTILKPQEIRRRLDSVSPKPSERFHYFWGFIRSQPRVNMLFLRKKPYGKMIVWRTGYSFDDDDLEAKQSMENDMDALGGAKIVDQPALSVPGTWRAVDKEGNELSFHNDDTIFRMGYWKNVFHEKHAVRVEKLQLFASVVRDEKFGLEQLIKNYSALISHPMKNKLPSSRAKDLLNQTSKNAYSEEEAESKTEWSVAHIVGYTFCGCMGCIALSLFANACFCPGCPCYYPDCSCLCRKCANSVESQEPQEVVDENVANFNDLFHFGQTASEIVESKEEQSHHDNAVDESAEDQKKRADEPEIFNVYFVTADMLSSSTDGNCCLKN